MLNVRCSCRISNDAIFLVLQARRSPTCNHTQAGGCGFKMGEIDEGGARRITGTPYALYLSERPPFDHERPLSNILPYELFAAGRFQRKNGPGGLFPGRHPAGARDAQASAFQIDAIGDGWPGSMGGPPDSSQWRVNLRLDP